MKKLVKYLSILLNGFAKKERQHPKDIEVTDMEGLSDVYSCVVPPIEEMHKKDAFEERPNPAEEKLKEIREYQERINKVSK